MPNKRYLYHAANKISNPNFVGPVKRDTTRYGKEIDEYNKWKSNQEKEKLIL